MGAPRTQKGMSALKANREYEQHDDVDTDEEGNGRLQHVSAIFLAP